MLISSAKRYVSSGEKWTQKRRKLGDAEETDPCCKRRLTVETPSVQNMASSHLDVVRLGNGKWKSPDQERTRKENASGTPIPY